MQRLYVGFRFRLPRRRKPADRPTTESLEVNNLATWRL